MNKRIKRANHELKDQIANATIEKVTRLNVEHGEDRMFGKCDAYEWRYGLEYIKGEGYRVYIRNNREQNYYFAHMENGQVNLVKQIS